MSEKQGTSSRSKTEKSTSKGLTLKQLQREVELLKATVVHQGEAFLSFEESTTLVSSRQQKELDNLTSRLESFHGPPTRNCRVCGKLQLAGDESSDCSTCGAVGMVG